MDNSVEQFYTVLIVDDEHLARELLMDYVSKIPMLKLVASCANAMEAMSFIQREHIDILLTDIEMPDITGWILCLICRIIPASFSRRHIRNMHSKVMIWGWWIICSSPFRLYDFVRRSTRRWIE